MKRGLLRVIVIIFAILLMLLFILFQFGRVNATYGHVVVTSLLAETPLTALLTQATSSQSYVGIEPPVLAALIGAAATLLAALIGGAFIVYQVRKSQSQHNPERDSNRSGVTVLFTRKTRRHPKTYRKALLKDDRIATFKILGMSEPLKVSRIYVPIQLHSDPSLTYTLAPELVTAEAQHDPNALFRAERERLESRARTASNYIEVIRTKTHCIILGDPGAGKTTFLKHLALGSAGKQLPGLPDLPIHIELSTFANSGSLDLLHFAANQWEEKYRIPEDKAFAYMTEHMAAGKALLLLDALDETLIGETGDDAEALYKRSVEAIQKVATAYPTSPIVVTVRKAGYYQRATPLTGFTELEVLDFRPRDIQRFVDFWFDRYTDPQKRIKGKDLKVKLEGNPRIEKLASTPLLLSLIVLVYETQLELPDRRAELYKQCVDTLLNRWDATRGIHRLSEFTPEHKRQLLTEVAWHFHTQGRRYFPANELLEVIANFLPAVGLQAEKNRQVLKEIVTESGLLKEQAQEFYGFLHLTLQEYFVARYVVDQNKLDTQLAHRDDPWWEEVILLYAGHTSDASLLLQRLLAGNGEAPLKEDIFYTNLILAGRCLAARPVVRHTSLRSEVTSRLLKTLTNTPNAFMRYRILQTLVEIGESEINASLIGLLSDQQINLTARQQIAYALESSTDRTLANALFPRISDQQIDLDVRKAIALTLMHLGERSLVPASLRYMLLPLLSDQQIDPEIRKNIAYILGDLGERSIASEMLQLVSDRGLDWNVRVGIAYALGASGERSVVPKLLSLLLDQKIELLVRASIVYALVDLDHYERPLVSKLLKPISHQKIKRFVPTRIRNILDRLGTPAVSPKLLPLLSNEQLEPYIRGRIVEVLSRRPSNYRIRKLRQRLSNQQLHPFVRGMVAIALGEMGRQMGRPDMVVTKLVTLLSDARLHPFVRWNIVEALGILNDRSDKVISTLISLQADSQLDLLLHATVVEALGKLGEHSVARELLQLISDPQLDLLLSRSSIDTVGKVNDCSGGDEVLQRLSKLQTNCVERVSLARVLGELGERSVVPELLQLLTNPQLEPKVRQSVVDALGELGDPSTVPKLLPLLSNPQFEQVVRERIARIIASLGNDEATVSTLYALLETSDIADDICYALWRVSRRAKARKTIWQEKS